VVAKRGEAVRAVGTSLEEGVTMRKAAVAVMGIAAMMNLAGCPDDDDDDDLQTREWSADLEGEPGWEDIGGEALVVWVEEADQFTASIEITGDEEGAVRPWHLHFNTCEAGGGIVGEDQDYPRLFIDEDGNASETVTISRRIDPDDAYHVNVHLSDDELETIIACADVITGD
jgi:hypothetical protein